MCCCEFVAVGISDRRTYIFCVSVGPRELPRRSGCAMAVVAFKLHIRTVRCTADRPHMQHMIQLDRAGIARIVLERRKLRVSVLKAANVRSEMCPAAVRTQ